MLRESKGNMYTWLTHTWNPIKGKCSHNCSYCYVKRWGEQKPIHIDEKEFKTDLSSTILQSKFIFVGSSCDLFANDIPYDWIERVLEYCSRFTLTTFLFQTKNPGRLYNFIPYMPSKYKICTTIETNRYYPEMGETPKPVERAYYMNKIALLAETYVTIEPIMDFDLFDMIAYISHCKPKQVNIGADSGNNGLKEPEKGKIMDLIEELKKFTIIDQKRNLNRLLK